MCLFELPDNGLVELATLACNNLTAFGVFDVTRNALTEQLRRDKFHCESAAIEENYIFLVKIIEQVFSRHPQRAQRHGRREFAPPIDSHIKNVARIELEIDPTAPIWNYSR